MPGNSNHRPQKDRRKQQQHGLPAPCRVQQGHRVILIHMHKFRLNKTCVNDINRDVNGHRRPDQLGHVSEMRPGSLVGLFYCCNDIE